MWSWKRPRSWPSIIASWSATGPWVLAAVLVFLLVRPDPAAIALSCVAVGAFVLAFVRYARRAPVRAERAEQENLRLLGDQAGGQIHPRPRPWWTSRTFGYGRRPLAWVPISLWYLVPIWAVWFGVVVAVGLTVPGVIQDWLPALYIVGWAEIVRRLSEPVAERLGGAGLERARTCDAFGSWREPWRVAFFVVLQLAILGLAWGVLSTGWFRGYGVGASFGFMLLFVFAAHDLMSRWRWRHAA
jgi:hypothetical protein